MKNHDALWKGLLQAFFGEFLEVTVPAVAERLKTEESRFLEQEAFVDPPEGRRALLDLVAEVPARDGPDEVVLVHVEVERSFGHAMDLRMWRYFCHLSLKYRRSVIPIVLFLSGGQAGVTRRRVDQKNAGFLINRFTYWALGLSGSSAQSLLEYGPLGVALASCARGDRLPVHEQKLLCMEAILDTRVNSAQEELLVTAVETYLELNEDQQMKYSARVAESPRHTEVKRMELTWAGKLHEKGRREGVELGRLEGVELGRREGVELGRREGVELGRLEGVELGRREGVELGRREGVELGRVEGVELARRTLVKILDQRFGQAPDGFVERLRKLDDPARLDAITDRVLKASSLADVENLLGS